MDGVLPDAGLASVAPAQPWDIEIRGLRVARCEGRAGSSEDFLGAGKAANLGG